MRHIKTDIAVFFLLFFVLPPFVWGADIRVQLEKNSASIEKEVDIAQAGLIKMQAGKGANPANLDASIRNLRRQLKELYSSLRRAEPSYGASLDEMKNITARLTDHLKTIEHARSRSDWNATEYEFQQMTHSAKALHDAALKLPSKPRLVQTKRPKPGKEIPRPSDPRTAKLRPHSVAVVPSPKPDSAKKETRGEMATAVPQVYFATGISRTLPQQMNTIEEQVPAPRSLSRSEKISAMNQLRRSANISTRSTESDPEVAIRLTPAVPVSGPNFIELLRADNKPGPPGTGISIVTCSEEEERDTSGLLFNFRSLVPGTTYLIDIAIYSGSFYGMAEWLVFGGPYSNLRVSEAIDSSDRLGHILLGFTADSERERFYLKCVGRSGLATFYSVEVIPVN